MRLRPLACAPTALLLFVSAANCTVFGPVHSDKPPLAALRKLRGGDAGQLGGAGEYGILLKALERAAPQLPGAFPLSYYRPLSVANWVVHSVYEFVIDPLFIFFLARHKAHVPKSLVGLSLVAWTGGAIDLLFGHTAIPRRMLGVADASRLELVAHSWAALCFATLAMGAGPVLALPARHSLLACVIICAAIHRGAITFKSPAGIALNSAGLLLTIASPRLPWAYKAQWVVKCVLPAISAKV